MKNELTAGQQVVETALGIRSAHHATVQWGTKLARTCRLGYWMFPSCLHSSYGD